MSRIGKKPIAIPKGVTVKVAADAVEVQGPKGKMRQAVPPGIVFAQDNGALVATLERADDPTLNKFHGLARSLVANAVIGVTEGFKKELDIVGVGYPRGAEGQAGGVRPRLLAPGGVRHPERIDIAVDKQTHVTVTGVDRQLVGQVAANIHGMRKPDPYKQKGVRYMGEVLKKKVGKTGAK
jgi:large subunit ribosomal protein L6